MNQVNAESRMRNAVLAARFRFQNRLADPRAYRQAAYGCVLAQPCHSVTLLTFLVQK